MGKILFIVIALWLIFTILKRYFNNVNSTEKNATARSEDMVQCHRCNIHMPKSDSILINDQYYCCADHSKDLAE